MRKRSNPGDIARIRRHSAEGAGLAGAVNEAGGPNLGPAAKWDQWLSLDAARLGMPPELLALLTEEGVTDVLVSGDRVWVDRGQGTEQVKALLGSDPTGRHLAIRMAAAAGRRLDDASPLVDGVLGDRYRLHAVLPPIAHGAASISIRVARRRPFTMEELVTSGSVAPSFADLLHERVREAQSLLICGGTGTGKTTLLSTLLGLVPPTERIVCIEEVSELAINHPHVIRLQSREPNIEGEGGIGLDELVRAAVRMRPDRVVLGECRGSEVREVLTAMNTGHRGSCATIHANSIEDVPARLIALGALGGLSPEAVAALAVPAFDVLLYLSRDGKGRRFVESLGELRFSNGRLSGVVTHRLAAGAD